MLLVIGPNKVFLIPDNKVFLIPDTMELGTKRSQMAEQTEIGRISTRRMEMNKDMS